MTASRRSVNEQRPHQTGARIRSLAVLQR